MLFLPYCNSIYKATEIGTLTLNHLITIAKKNQSDSILFLFDEPSTGLHFHDIDKLLISLNALVARGHTVLVVEHHLDIIKCADWVIDLGPEGGITGGNLVFEGTPEELVKEKKSYTGEFLKSKIKG